ncbi:MAG: hypothetical protein EBU90_05860 [Proteobacteria bacterium]|nr:hypothetical protein [Pseudomonadota bacterium]
MTWKAVVSVIPLTKARNSSFTLMILIANAACALAASCDNELFACVATFNAASAVANCCNNGNTLPICLKPPSSSAILIKVISLSPRPLSASLNLLIASYGPMNLPSKSTNSIPNCFKNSIVCGLCILVKIVLE